MQNLSIWRTRPVFISSTFTDFQSERDLLQTLVFPELSERLRVHRHDLEPIDLRIGVETASEADEERKALVVLSVCIQEVKRSRPFLVVLLGDRYGWTPPVDRARRAAEEAGLQVDVSGRSVTDIEIAAGLLQSGDEQAICARAYFRHLAPEEIPEELRHLYLDGDTTRIEALKHRIRQALGLSRCRDYEAVWDAGRGSVGGLGALRRMLVEDLWSDLEAETRRPHTRLETWHDHERETLGGFVHDTTREFNGRAGVLETLLSLASGSDDSLWGACVAGSPGSGKSSVAAELIRRLQNDSPILVLANVAGISPESTRVDRMLQRWSGELAAHLGESGLMAEQATGEDLEHLFTTLLRRASQGRRIAIVIDALNEFERTTRARHLTWLPRVWPANARLIATSVPGVETASLSRRPGCRILDLTPLTGDEASRILDAVYRRYGRRVNPSVKQALLEKRLHEGSLAAGNPLWLELACEEMNLLDAEDLARAAKFAGAVDEQLVALQLEIAVTLPPDVQAMYGRMLKRAESVAITILRQGSPELPETAGRVWVQCLSEAIAISRGGWREHDLEPVLGCVTTVPWSDLLFASVRRAYRGHLLQRGASGQWNFYHQQLREGVAAWFDSSEEYRRGLHAAFAGHLDTLPDDNSLRLSERMHHLIGADDRTGAAFLYANCEDGSDELQYATESLVDLVRRRPDGSAWIGGLLDNSGLPPAQRLLLAEKIMFPLHDALANEGYVEQRRQLLTMVRNHTERLAAQSVPGPDRHFAARQHSVALLRLADLAIDIGDPSAARPLYEEHQHFAEQQVSQFPQLVTAQQDLSVALERLADLSEREGNRNEASTFLRRQLEICRRVAEMQRHNPDSHSRLASVMERLGFLALAEGDAQHTELYLREAAAARNRVAELTGEGTSPHALTLLARLAEAKDEINEARNLYRQAESLLRRSAQVAPDEVEPQTTWSISLEAVGDLALFQRDLTEAKACFTQLLEIRRRLAEVLPEDVEAHRGWANALMKLADVLLQEECPSEARPYLQRALEIRERLHAQLPGEIRTCRDLGLALERLGMLEDASPGVRIEHLERAVAIYTEIHERMQDQEDAARTLALGHFALAQTLSSVPERQLEAIQHCAKAHELLSKLRAAGRLLDPSANRLLSFLDTRFGGSGRWTHPIEDGSQAAYDEANLQGSLGEQAMQMGDYKVAEAAFARSIEFARKANHPPSLVRAYGSLGELKMKNGKAREGLELLNRAIAIARENNLPVEEGQTLERVANMYADLGQHTHAVALYKERIAVAERTGHQRGVAMGSANVGVIYFETKNFESAIEYLRTAAEIFDSYHMWDEVARAYSYLGCAYQAVGDTDRAIQTYRDHIDMCHRTGDIGSAAGTMANLSLLLYAVGDREQAIRFGEQACDVLDQVGSPQAPAIRAKVDAMKR